MKFYKYKSKGYVLYHNHKAYAGVEDQYLNSAFPIKVPTPIGVLISFYKKLTRAEIERFASFMWDISVG